MGLTLNCPPEGGRYIRQDVKGLGESLGPPSENVDQLVDHLFRQEFGRMVSRLARILGAPRLAMAEDAVQYAMLQALQLWPYQGVPEYPQAWLAKVAYHRALDVLKNERRLRFYDDEKEVALRNQLDALQTTATVEPLRFSQEVADERLSLIFVCCHPALPRAASVALTLQVVCGFGVAEIARAFLSTETAITQRLVRAKRMIRDEALRCEVPDPEQLDERLGAVLEVLYLLFTEGYAATAGDQLVKDDLCAEAIRLAESLTENSATSQPECHALLALMLFQAARLPARTDALGDLLLLEEQDRSLWDRSRILLGLVHLEQAARGDKLSAYHLQAEIAAVHSTTEHFTLTNWENILALYDLLREKQPTPVVLINRAIAVAQVEGPAAGLYALKAIPVDSQMERYPFLHAAEGAFHRRLGHGSEAQICFQRALEFAHTEPQRRFLLRKLAALRDAE
jgi:predicted RNA polymerase sigma factor